MEFKYLYLQPKNVRASRLNEDRFQASLKVNSTSVDLSRTMETDWILYYDKSQHLPSILQYFWVMFFSLWGTSQMFCEHDSNLQELFLYCSRVISQLRNSYTGVILAKGSSLTCGGVPRDPWASLTFLDYQSCLWRHFLRVKECSPYCNNFH